MHLTTGIGSFILFFTWHLIHLHVFMKPFFSITSEGWRGDLALKLFDERGFAGPFTRILSYYIDDVDSPKILALLVFSRSITYEGRTLSTVWSGCIVEQNL